MSGVARDLDLARAAARSAAEAVMGWFGTPMDVVLKSPDQPLTKADLLADRIIKDILLGARPSYGWLSEETADSAERLEREMVWIVDPIDGTRSFIAGRPEFSISIGLARSGAVVLGVVCNPATQEYYWSSKGDGAFMAQGDGEVRMLSLAPCPPQNRKPIILASRNELSRGDFDSLRDEWEIKPLGSTAYKLAGVASGLGDVFFSRGPKSEWDVCAGALLVEEAGGVATDLFGEPFSYNKLEPFVSGVAASSGGLHRHVVNKITKLPVIGRV
jgi:myo-inositol-1(or 4)-monophosphatase